MNLFLDESMMHYEISLGADCVVKLRESSPFHFFLMGETGSSKLHYTIRQIADTLREKIWREGIFCPKNILLTISPPWLLELLNVNIFHHAQLEELIECRLINRTLCWTNSDQRPTDERLNGIVFAGGNPKQGLPSEWKFTVSNRLSVFLRSYAGLESDGRRYSYEEIRTIIDSWLMPHHRDQSNPSIFLLNEYLLAHGLDCSALHENQIDLFLANQLYPFSENNMDALLCDVDDGELLSTEEAAII